MAPWRKFWDLYLFGLFFKGPRIFRNFPIRLIEISGVLTFIELLQYLYHYFLLQLLLYLIQLFILRPLFRHFKYCPMAFCLHFVLNNQVIRIIPSCQYGLKGFGLKSFGRVGAYQVLRLIRRIKGRIKGRVTITIRFRGFTIILQQCNLRFPIFVRTFRYTSYLFLLVRCGGGVRRLLIDNKLINYICVRGFLGFDRWVGVSRMGMEVG